MDMTIGGRTLALKRDSASDAALVAATGCSAAEHAATLSSEATPFQVARALQPMLSGKDCPSLAALTALVADGDMLTIRLAAAALLRGDAPTPEKEA
ncbi:hypothetical protein BH10PSE14_BH10PSE14_04350 [soil metagenome]